MTEAVAIPNEIRGLLIPLSTQSLLLPNAAVAEIIDYHRLAPVEGMPEWVAGITEWRQRRLPVVHFEPLLGGPASSGQRRRIVVCHSLDSRAKWPFLGIASSAIPRLVRVREEILQGREMPEAWRELPLLAALSLDAQEALIPDLTALERRLETLDDIG